MSVRERMEQLAEEMDALLPPKLEVKTLREWLAKGGYVPPGNPADASVELRTLLAHLADLDVVVHFADDATDRAVYVWILKQLDGHLILMPGRIEHLDMDADVAAARNPRED